VILDSLAPLAASLPVALMPDALLPGSVHLPGSMQGRAALLTAHAALDAQASALASLARRLEALGRTVPTGDTNAHWRGPAQLAYRSSVRELAARLDEAAAVVAAAQAHSSRALSTIAARVR
jgi:hypothetical protein